jgi:hypothetical protein
MNREELDEKIERTLAENRAVIERSEARSRKLEREAPIRLLSMELAFQRLREAARRR